MSSPEAALAAPTAPPPDHVSRETITTAIINQKGGVGKTTTAVSLAHGLALQNKRVLLVDLDPQANATLSLGVTPGETQGAAAHHLLVDAPPPTPVRTRCQGLDLLAGSPELIAAEITLLQRQHGRERALSAGFTRMQLDYDHVVIDAPPSLGLLAINILQASDALLVPVQAEFLALEGVKNLRRTVELLSTQAGSSAEILGFLITMVDGRTNLSQSVAAGLRNTLGSQVFNAVIPRTVRLSECPSLRKTIFEYDRWGSGARAYEALVFEFLGRLHGIRTRRRRTEA